MDLPARRCTTATMRLARSSSSARCHSRGVNGSAIRSFFSTRWTVSASPQNDGIDVLFGAGSAGVASAQVNSMASGVVVPPILTSCAFFQPIRALVHQYCAATLLCFTALLLAAPGRRARWPRSCRIEFAAEVLVQRLLINLEHAGHFVLPDTEAGHGQDLAPLASEGRNGCRVCLVWRPIGPRCGLSCERLPTHHCNVAVSGMISMQCAARPVISAAMMVVPEPTNGS